MSYCKRFAIFLCAGAFSVLFWFVCARIPVGLTFDGAEGRSVTCVVAEANRSLEMTAYVNDGRVLFDIPVGVRHFHFVLQPSTDPWRLKAVTICGMSLFPAHWLISNVAPRMELYAPSALAVGEPLNLYVTAAQNELDYVRLFDLLPRLFRLVRIGLAAFPLGLCALFWMLRGFVRIIPRFNTPKVFAAVVAVVVVGMLPNPVQPAMPGLDASWSWILNHLVGMQAYGREVVFTYGPLGFLLFPQLPLVNIWTALCANVLFVLAWGWLLLGTYRTSGGRPCAWLLVLSTLVVQANNEWRWVMLGILCVALPFVFGERLSRRRAVVSFALGGVVLVVVSLMKFSSLVTVLTTQVFFMIGYWWRTRRKGMVPCLFYGAATIVMFSALSAVCFSSFDAFLAWVRGSLATANGYNLYMAPGKSWVELCLPFAILLSLLAIIVVRRGFTFRDLRVVFLFSPFLFCTMKYALVRQTSLPLMYGSVALLALVLLERPVLSRRAVGLSTAFLVLSLGLTVPWLFAGIWSGDFLFGLNPSGVFRVVCLRQSIADAQRMTELGVQARDIPVAWRERIGTGRVLFVPYEMAPAMMPETMFQTVCLPSVQLYSACHPYLDALNGERIAGDHAPEWVVCGIDVDWSGHCVNYPVFWQTFLRTYEYVDQTDAYVLLKRRSQRLSPVVSATCVADVPVETWFDCTPYRGTAVRIVWPQSACGRFCGTFLRATAAHVTVRYDDGVQTRFQLIAGNTAASAFPIDWIPSDRADFVKVLKGEPRHRPVALRFDVTTPAQFTSRVTIK